jgi:chromate transporter
MSESPPNRLQLFLGFLQIGVTGFGGVMPIARRALVEKRRWVSPEQFALDMAMAQLLPGPNIVNLSVAIGLRFGGLSGAALCFIGILALPLVILLILLTLYARSGGIPIVAQALHGVTAVAAGLIGAMAWRVAAPLFRSSGDLVIVALTTLAMVGLRLPLLPVLIVGAALGVALALRRQRVNGGS